MEDKKIIIIPVSNSVIAEDINPKDYNANDNGVLVEQVPGKVINVEAEDEKPMGGIITPLVPPSIIFPDGHGHLKYQGAPEMQFNRNFDSYSCFPYDTEILMENLSKKRISEVKVGDYVITHLGRKRKVLKTMKRENNEEVYSIKVNAVNEEIVCTKEHPFLTDKGWVKAEDLKQGDLVCQLLLSNYSKDITSREVEKDKDFLWFLGMYLAEGNLGHNKKCDNNNPKLKVNGSGKGSGTIVFSLSNQERNIADKIIQIGKRLFDTNFTIYKYKNKGDAIQVVGYNYFLRNLLEELGNEYCDKKELSEKMMLLEPYLQMEIYKGWTEGDGHIDIKKRLISGVSTSKKLVEQFHLILLKNKIKSSIYKRKEREDRKPVWSLNVHGEELNKIYPLGLDKNKNGRTKNEYFDDNYLYKRIDKISKTKLYKGNLLKRVYNIEVEEDNTYIINGNIVVHNCVIYTIAKAICYNLKERYDIDITISEMFNAFYAPVYQGRGTTIRNGMESFRLHGWVEDKDYPFTAETTLRQFQAQPPITIVNKAKKELTKWKFNWEVVGKDNSSIINALQRTVLVATGFAWASYYGNEGIYFDYNNPANHAFLVVDYKANKNIIVDDSYPRDNRFDEDSTKDEFIKELDKSYNFGSCHRVWLEPILPEPKNNSLINIFKTMFLKICRDIHGALFFVKDGKKQKLTDWLGFAGAVIDEVGCATKTDSELNSLPDFKFFGKE